MNIAITVSLENFINQLSLKDKIELARRLERETRGKRWNGLLSRLRKRMTKTPTSDKDILTCVKETRKILHA